MGGVNVAQQQAAQNQQALQGADLQTPEGLRAAAKKMLEMGNQKSAYLLGQKAAELEKEQAATALAQQKQDEAEQFRRDQLAAKIEQDKVALEARSRYEQGILESKSASEETKRAIAAQHDQTLLMLKQMDAQTKQMIAGMRQSSQGTDTGLKPYEVVKLRQAMGKDKIAIGASENTATDLDNAVKDLVSSAGFDSITGWNALTNAVALPNSEASASLSKLQALEGKVKTLGRNIQSQQGGKLGNMAVKEWDIVANSIANLNPKSKDFKNQLDNIVAQAKQAAGNIRSGYEDEYAPYFEQMPELKLKSKPTQPPPPTNNDKFVVGKKYKDGKGNIATYLGNGQWGK
jgi:hypothetical protein